MIYTLTYSFANENQVVQWYNILDEQDYLNIQNINHIGHHNTNNKLDSTREFFDKNIDSNFNIKTDEKSILIIDSEYIFFGGNDDHNVIESNVSRLNNSIFDKVIIMSKDHFIHESYESGKVEIYSPNQSSDYPGTLNKKFNFYLINAAYNEVRNTSQKLFDYFKYSQKEKKFSLLMGSFKPFRTLLYNSLKKNNILDDIYISYMSYDKNLEEETFQNHFFEKYNFDRDKLLEIITHEDFRELKKDLPLNLDGNYSEDNFSILPPLNYLSNSYIQIVDCNVFSTYSYTDEKLFRPFMCFNIPIFFGPKGINQLLKNYGFDLFEDIFDLNRDGDGDDIERFKASLENVKKIQSMTKSELHFLYITNKERLQNNFNLLKNIGKTHISEFIKVLNEYN
jgi:hypothetical protein